MPLRFVVRNTRNKYVMHLFLKSQVSTVPSPRILCKVPKREFIDYKTSIITDQDPLRGLLFC